MKEEHTTQAIKESAPLTGVAAAMPENGNANAFERFFSPNYEVNHSARLFQSHYENVWDSERDQQRHPRWMDSTAGRFGIRLFSRGLMGSAFLTAGSLMLEKYQPASRIGAGVLPTIEEWAAFKANPKEKSYTITRILTPIARSYDFLFGKPIEYLFGKEAVTFRRLRSFEHFETNSANVRMGRTFGEEAVHITLDFAMGSIGDAWGRRIAGILDPNVKKDWLDKDGHVQWGKLAKATGKAAFDILSYNQMEDWFAAVPYVYQMRWQRHFLDRYVQRGSRLAIEHGTFGGAFQVDERGKIIGDYSIPGAIDLQLRFTGYNVYTLLFRDLYQHIKHSFDHRKDDIKPEHERNFLDESVKYLAKTAMKATTYMTPAMPFFWIPRVSSARMEGPRIYAGATPHQDCMVVTSQNINGDRFRSYTHFDRKLPDIELTRGRNGPKIERNPEYRVSFNPYDKANSHTTFSSMLRPFGKASDFAGNIPAWGMEKLGGLGERLLAKNPPAPGSEDARKRQLFYNKVGHRYFNNAFSYTPYMIAKYETANWWDTPQMDASLYRMLDGVDNLDWKEVKAGAKDYWQVLKRRPVSAETERMTYEPRGLINSQRHNQDSDNRRDGKLTQSFADFQRENRVMRKRAAHGDVDAMAASMAMEQPSPVAKNTPENAIQPRGENGWAAYELQRMQPRDGQKQRPEGVTLH